MAEKDDQAQAAQDKLQEDLQSDDLGVRMAAQRQLRNQVATSAAATASAPAPAASDAAPALKPRPSVAQMASDAYNNVHFPDLMSSDTVQKLTDPANLGAVTGAAHSLWNSGASYNPFNSKFLQYPKDKLEEAMSGLDRYVKSQVHSDLGVDNILAKDLSNATGMPIRSNSEAQAAIDAIKAQEASRTPVTKMVNGAPKVVRYVQQGATEATPLVSSNMFDQATAAAAKYLPDVPGVQAATKWAKSVAPTIGGMASRANIAGQLADFGTRVYQGDIPGAAISAAGAAAPMLLAPEVAIPATVGALATNYLRDNPNAIAPSKMNGNHPSQMSPLSILRKSLQQSGAAGGGRGFVNPDDAQQ